MGVDPPQVRACRAVTEELAQRYGQCQACGARIGIFGAEDFASMEYKLIARCHGTTETMSVDIYGALEPAEDYEKIAAWMRGLFAADCNPDVMELLRRNREAA